METIGIYKDVPLTADPGVALIFAVIGWIIVLAIMFYAVHKWIKKRAEVAK
jgi:hypothetical protein